MSEEQEIPFANVLGRHDILDFKAKLFLGLLAIVFAGILYVFYIENQALRAENAKLRESNIMYGYANSDGVFVSSRIMPEGHIKAFVRQFVNNYYNYNADSVDENLQESFLMMCPKYKMHVELRDTANARSVHRNQINQDFDMRLQSDDVVIEKDKQGRGYRVEAFAERTRSTAGRIYDKRRGRVELVLLRVKHSAHYEWGLTVCGIDENMKQVSLR